MPLWNREPEHLVKLVLVGDAGIGKTSFLLRFVENKFDTNPSTVAVDFKLTTFKVNSSYIKLQIWDTAGQERFRTISSAYYRGAHGVLLMCDTTSTQSFANLTHWAREVNQHCTDAVNVVLVANKCDLGEKRTVTRERMEELAESRGWKYFETSGKTGTNVQQAIRSLVNQIVKNRAYAAHFASLRGNAGLTAGGGAKLATSSSPSLSSILSSPSFGSRRDSSSSEHMSNDSLESSLLESGCNPAARVVMGAPRVRAGRSPVEGTIRLEAYNHSAAQPSGSSCCSGSGSGLDGNAPVRSRSAQSLGLGQGIEVEWEPDTASSCCRNCDQQFTAVRRRHHCRWCGKLFCKYCCHNKLPREQLPVTLIPNAADVKRGLGGKCRICNTCFQWVSSMAEKPSTQSQTSASVAVSPDGGGWAPAVARTVSADLTIDEQLQIRSQFTREVSQKFR